VNGSHSGTSATSPKNIDKLTSDVEIAEWRTFTTFNV
jgi:hypothetical protein